VSKPNLPGHHDADFSTPKTRGSPGKSETNAILIDFIAFTVNLKISVTHIIGGK
jgi:multisubunit Na+/H+ antiporter MnhB subunit